MKHKYSIGSIVVITKWFNREKCGLFEKCDSKLAKVLDVHHTPTCGYAYKLEVNGKPLGVCYWETDIDGFYCGE